MAAASFKPNGKSTKAAASSEAEFIAPEFKARFDKGLTVVPYLHSKSVGTVMGAAVDIS